jgi:hypothetical protein
MADEDVVTVLREIADLLRHRIEQASDFTKQAAERLARAPDLRQAKIPDFASIEAKHQEAAAARHDEDVRRRAEDIEFRERLLTAIERQNELIAQLIRDGSAAKPQSQS